MPTGYTAAIADGIDFPTFAMNCARAFGACVDLRDAPSGGEQIPTEFAVSAYHAEKLKELRAERDELLGMNLETLSCMAREEALKRRAEAFGYLKEKRVLLCKYDQMLKTIQGWRPPTNEHVGLKNFMIEQIEKSIESDCSNTDYLSNQLSKPTLSGAEWRERKERKLTEDIEYHSEHQRIENELAKERTEWVTKLRESLGVG